MAAALRKDGALEEVARCLEFYPQAEEVLDDRPRPAHVSAMANLIEKRAKALTGLLSKVDGTVTCRRPEEGWSQDCVVVVQQILEGAMFQIRHFPGVEGVIASEKLLTALDNADVATLHQLDGFLRAKGLLLHLGDGIGIVLNLVADACADVIRSQRGESRGFPKRWAMRHVCSLLDRLFRSYAGGNSRGRPRFISRALAAADIPQPVRDRKLTKLFPPWNKGAL